MTEPDHESIPVKILPQHIDIFNKIIEGYDNLAVVTTTNAALGEVLVRVTQDTRKDVLKILKRMPFQVKIFLET